MSAPKDQTACLVTNAENVTKLRAILEELNLNDSTRRLKFLKEENLVAVPVRMPYSQTATSADDLMRIISKHEGYDSEGSQLEIMSMDLPTAKKLTVKSPQQVLKTALQKLLEQRGFDLSEELNRDLPGHWEKHGDLVLVPPSCFTLPLWAEIGDEVWKVAVKSLGCVRLAQKSSVSVDGFRTPQVRMLYGDNSWVLHTDNGIRYTYDITKCMFSAGNITEKLRIAGFNCEGETVVDLYAGIGYFTLPYLVYTGVKHLHACEWNPDAVEALKKNLELNNVQDRCMVYPGDNRKVCPRGIADRVNLGLIPSSREGWPVACAALRPDTGGILHIHYNVNTKPVNHEKCECSLPRREQTNNTSCEPMTCIQCKSGTCTQCNLGTCTEREPKTYTQCEPTTCTECEPRTGTQCEPGTWTECNNHSTTRNGEFLTCFSNQNMAKHDTCKNNTCIHLHSSEPLEVFRQEAKCQIKSARSECQTINACTEQMPELKIGCENFATETMDDENCKSLVSKVTNYKWHPWAVQTAMEIKNIMEGLYNASWRTEILHIEHVKSYAPFVDHIVLDLKCKPGK